MVSIRYNSPQGEGESSPSSRRSSSANSGSTGSIAVASGGGFGSEKWGNFIINVQFQFMSQMCFGSFDWRIKIIKVRFIECFLSSGIPSGNFWCWNCKKGSYVVKPSQRQKLDALEFWSQTDFLSYLRSFYLLALIASDLWREGNATDKWEHFLTQVIL